MGQNFLNYVQHNLPGGAKNFLGASPPLVTHLLLHDCSPWKRVILFLCSERIQRRSTAVAWLTGVRGYKPPPWQAKHKNRNPLRLYFGLKYCFGFQQVVFLRFRKSFWWFRIFVYRYPHSDTLSFLNFFLSEESGPLRWPLVSFSYVSHPG